LNHLEDARRSLLRAIELKPIATVYANLCGVEFDRKAMDAAGAACRKAVELQPASPIAWGNLAMCWWKATAPPKPVEAYRKALEFGQQQLTLNPVMRTYWQHG
jgi:tetratricopeptide (TPR) repeat protein